MRHTAFLAFRKTHKHARRHKFEMIRLRTLESIVNGLVEVVASHQCQIISFSVVIQVKWRANVQQQVFIGTDCEPGWLAVDQKGVSVLRRARGRGGLVRVNGDGGLIRDALGLRIVEDPMGEVDLRGRTRLRYVRVDQEDHVQGFVGIVTLLRRK